MKLTEVLSGLGRQLDELWQGQHPPVLGEVGALDLDLLVDLGVLSVDDLDAVQVLLLHLHLDGGLDAQAGVVGGQLGQAGQEATLILEGVLPAGPEQAVLGGRGQS